MAAPILGILAQSMPAANTDTDLYTVPAGRRCVVSTLAIAETGGAATTARAYARKNGAAVAQSQRVVPDVAIAANSHTGVTEGWTLAAGDVVTIRGGTAAVSFTLFGEETDVPTA